MDIIKAGPAQAAAIEKLENACFSCPCTPAQIMSMLRADTAAFAAAMEGDALLGYAGFTSVLDEGYIVNVAVDERHRRRGLGDALIGALVGFAREKGLAFLTLEVREGNAAARALYEKHGFIDVGLRKNYYEKPRENAVLMTLWLEKAQ